MPVYRPDGLRARPASIALEGLVRVVRSWPAKGHIHGLTLSNNSTDATNDIDIAAGEAVESDTLALMVLGASMTKRLDAAWAVGTGNGGLDTGAIANTTYHVWLIGAASAGGGVDVLFSASATSPTMPTGYTLKWRIGSIRRVSAAIVAFKQLGDVFLLDVPVQDILASNPGTSAVLATLSVPLGIKVRPLATAVFRDDTPAGFTYFLITSPDQTDTAPTGTVRTGYTTATSPAHTHIPLTGWWTNTSAQLRYRLSASTTDHIVSFDTYGWIDTRGKDA